MAYVTPSSRATGDIVSAAIWNSDAVDNVKATSVGIVTTAGDMAYATAANVLARLALGTSGRFLEAGASAPAWSGMRAQRHPGAGARHIESNSASDTVGNNVTVDDAYSFSDAYGSTPVVTCAVECAQGANQQRVLIKAATIGTTGVTISKLNENSGGDQTMISHMHADGAD